jgi:hypothetical protein
MQKSPAVNRGFLCLDVLQQQKALTKQPGRKVLLRVLRVINL